jgi:hypothetical protein
VHVDEAWQHEAALGVDDPVGHPAAVLAGAARVPDEAVFQQQLAAAYDPVGKDQLPVGDQH